MPDVGMNIAEVVRKAGVSVGYDQLKDEQVNILGTFVEGSDVFVSFPIGFGKSLFYMLLPLMFVYLAVESGGGKAIVVVISPLTARDDNYIPAE